MRCISQRIKCLTRPLREQARSHSFNRVLSEPLAHRIPMWERACSRMRCISQRIKCLTHRFREQARSHSFNRVMPEPLAHRIPMWERACSRMRCISQHIKCLTRPLREQARSHRFDRVMPEPLAHSYSLFAVITASSSPHTSPAAPSPRCTATPSTPFAHTTGAPAAQSPRSAETGMPPDHWASPRSAGWCRY